jgi:cadmium resistance protein CadD (predicted permease)
MIGYLGVVPLFLGCHMLYEAWRSSGHEAPKIVNADGRGERAIWFSTFIVMFSNSGDSIAVFLPLLAESGRGALLVIICTYLLSALVWAALSYCIAGQRELAVRIEARAEKIIPWMMIGVGLYILMDSSTDTLV